MQPPKATSSAIDQATPTSAFGLIAVAKQAEAIIAEGRADWVALARGFLYHPHWPWYATAVLGATVNALPPHWR